MKAIIGRASCNSDENAAPAEGSAKLDTLNTALLKGIQEIGARIPCSTGRTWSIHALFAAIALSPSPLLAIDLCSKIPLDRLIWLPNLALFDYAQLAFSWLGWRRLRSIANALDDMLSLASTDERIRVARGIKCCSHPVLLVCAMTTFGGISVAVILVAKSADGNSAHLSATIAGYIILTGLLAGHSAFGVVSGFLLAKQILGVSTLKLLWPAPINTPGLVGLFRAAREVSRLGLGLFVLAQIPLTVFFHNHHASASVDILYLGNFALGAGLITVTGLIFPAMLSQRVKTAKDAMLMTENRNIEDAHRSLEVARPGSLRETTRMARLAYRVQIYQAIDSARTSYLSPGTLAQYLASLAAVVAQFTVPILFN